MLNLLNRLSPFVNHLLATFERAFLRLTQPSRQSLALSIAYDLPRSKSQLIAENALLRQQLIVLYRQIKKSRFTPSDRLWLVLLAGRVQQWKDTLLILKPDTLLRWHRQGFRLFWKIKSRNRGGRPRLAIETINLIQQMAKENLLWGLNVFAGNSLNWILRPLPRLFRNTSGWHVLPELIVKLGQSFSIITRRAFGRVISCR